MITITLTTAKTTVMKAMIAKNAMKMMRMIVIAATMMTQQMMVITR